MLDLCAKIIEHSVSPQRSDLIWQLPGKSAAESPVVVSWGNGLKNEICEAPKVRRSEGAGVLFQEFI